MKARFSIATPGFFLLLACVISTNWSCKENAILPKELVPAVDNINTFDSTFDLITHTIYQDSFPTGGLKGGLRISSANTFYHACGSIQADPAFGSTFASMHVEVLPAVPNFSFKAATANVTIDSVVLSMPYRMAFGDTNFSSLNQKFRLFRSTGSFSRDSAQYEFTNDTINTADLLSVVNVNFSSLYRDSLLVAGQKQQPQLHFKLASWFADSLKAQVDLGANGALATFGSYLQWWKGFAIVPSSTKGNTLGYFDTYRTKMTIYYRYTNTGGGQDTTNDVFSFDPNYCNRFNTIIQNQTGSKSKPFINTKSASGDSLLFIQNEPGLVNTFHAPGITNMKNVIVNKAELVFTVAPSQNFSDTLAYGLIPRLQIFSTDTAGNNDKVAADYAAFNSSAYVNGKRSTVIINGMNYVQYKFNVTYSIQRIISQKDSTFRYKIMGASNGLPGAYRTILTGSGSQNQAFKPRLYLIYTNIHKQ